ncbi:MAG TPA: ATP synthase F1 subunit gamma [Spirochaetes bacterium]|nr:ATP synthase F1 subunit gamma [Spirochaetota bacterium]
MATVREIRNQIGSVQNIKKITETMEKISTAKVKKNTKRLASSREYYHSLIGLMDHLIQYFKDDGLATDHPLIKSHDSIANSLILVITSNRGLCGGYNNNVLQLTKKLYSTLKEEEKAIKLFTIGKKGISYFQFNKIPTDQTFTDIDDHVDFDRMASIADQLSDLYSTEKVDEVYLVYTKYLSGGQQRPAVEKILPFDVETNETEELSEDYRPIYLFEPAGHEVLDRILPVALRIKVFNTILQTNLSEQIARKIAMKQASDSAGDMIKDLSLLYNRARQNKITKELIEIMGAAKALHS